MAIMLRSVFFLWGGPSCLHRLLAIEDAAPVRADAEEASGIAELAVEEAAAYKKKMGMWTDLAQLASDPGRVLLDHFFGALWIDSCR